MKFKSPLPQRKKLILGPATAPALIKVEYAPAPCDFTDELEHFCVLRLEVFVKYWDQGLELQERKGRIHDIIHRDRSEFIKMDCGIEIRLDHIFSLATE